MGEFESAEGSVCSGLPGAYLLNSNQHDLGSGDVWRTIMSDYSLVFPDGFEGYAWELEPKGWFNEARLEFQGRLYRLMFYDPTRLSQDIDDELQRGGVFFEPNLVVVPTVNRQNMEKAAAQLVQHARLGSLVAE
jgi:hypothetical protein